MSTLALPVAAPRARIAGAPLAWAVVAIASTLALALREVSVDAFVAWTALGFAALCLRSYVGRGRLDAGDVLLLFTLYYGMSMLVRGVGVITWVESPYLNELGDRHTAHLRDLVGWTLLYSALGLFAVQEGYRSAVALRWARSLIGRLPALGRPWRSSRVTFVAAGLVFLGVLGAGLRVASLGGIMRAVANPMAAGTDEALGHWWQIALTEFAVVGFHVHILRLLLRRDRRWLAHYLVLGLGLCGPIYLISSSKFLLLRTLFLPWIMRHYVTQRVSLWQLLAAFAGFSALFPLFYAYRALGLLNLDAVGLYLQTTETPVFQVFNRAYGADSFILILHRTGVTLPFQWGASLLDLGTFWIPRMLWAAKPDSFGLQFPAQYMPDMRWGAMTYVTTSLPGELYLNFHVVGVVVGSWLVGALMRVGRSLTAAGPGGVLVYCYLFLTSMHLAEGCIASQVETLLTDLVPAGIALALLTSRATRSGARVGSRA